MGNFGSTSRMDFTALGDTVNTAARTEGVNKYFGTRICVTEETVAQCPDLAFRRIGNVVLKGKTQPVGLFSPVSDAEAASGLVPAYAEASALLDIPEGGAPAAAQALGVPAPDVTAVSVQAARNVPGKDPQGADGEVCLDVEVVAAVVPAAAIRVYFAPNTDAGFVAAVSQATHDSAGVTVMSISWGSAESTWTASSTKAFDAALADAAAIGVTVCVAAGDGGSADGQPGGEPHADFPASSPHALGCGGTRLPASGAEVVWNDGADGGSTGGGVSTVFGVPDFQRGLTVGGAALTGRGVPDVAADADPQTGYQVRIDGSDTVIGGTSAAAPLWAALIARLQQGAGATRWLTPLLYALPAGTLHDITSGDNGAYAAGPGWDACTGLGSPDGAAIAAALPPTTPTATAGGPSAGSS